MRCAIAGTRRVGERVDEDPHEQVVAPLPSLRVGGIEG
jgi:hypothetical protein